MNYSKSTNDRLKGVARFSSLLSRLFRGFAVCAIMALAILTTLPVFALWYDELYEFDWEEQNDGTYILMSDRKLTYAGFVLRDEIVTGYAVTTFDKSNKSTKKTKWTTTIKDINIGKKAITFSGTRQLNCDDDTYQTETTKSSGYRVTNPVVNDGANCTSQYINPEKYTYYYDGGSYDCLQSDWMHFVELVEPKSPFKEWKDLGWQITGNTLTGNKFTVNVKVGSDAKVAISGTMPDGKSGSGESYVTLWMPAREAGEVCSEDEDSSWCYSWEANNATALIPVVMFDSGATECLAFELNLEKINGKWEASVNVDECARIGWTRKQTNSVGLKPNFTIKKVNGSSSGVQIPAEWQKARTLKGATGIGGVAPAYEYNGFFEVKCGKANKKGVAKVSCTETSFLTGKKKTYKSQSVTVGDDPVVLTWGEGEDSLVLTIDGNEFSAYWGEDCCGGRFACSAQIGGKITGSHTMQMPEWFDYDMDRVKALLKLPECYCDNTGPMTYSDYGVTFSIKGKNLIFVSSEWGKSKLPKITYNESKGTLAGSMQIIFDTNCCDFEDNRRVKTKTVKLKVSGGAVNERLYGFASYKKISTPITMDEPFERWVPFGNAD